MNDPHVSELKYRLRTGTDVSYEPGTSINWSTPEFDGELSDGMLSLKMKTHHSSVGSAQNAVSGLLKAWEIKTGLDQGLGNLEFEFDSSEIIDLSPSPPGGPYVYAAGAGSFLVIGGAASCHVTKASYPPPPADFSVSPIVQTLWQRFQGYLDKKEPLTGMGYFCLSVIQADAGGRRNAAVKYAIQLDVLDNLGRLTSEVGDEATARKLDPGSTFRPHTQAEQEWITAAVRRLIMRAGEIASSPSGVYPQIQMSDLPTI